MDVALAFKDFDQRFEAKIAARRNLIFFAGGYFLVVSVPGILVVAGLGERAANGLFDAHTSGGVTFRLAGNAEIGALGIFAQGKFDSGERAFKR